MLVVLKIPVIYLATVVLWAVRAEPELESGGEEAGVFSPLGPCGWNDWKRNRPKRPSRGPVRSRRVRATTRVRTS